MSRDALSAETRLAEGIEHGRVRLTALTVFIDGMVEAAKERLLDCNDESARGGAKALRELRAALVKAGSRRLYAAPKEQRETTR